MSNFTLTLVRGIPGSGKTTFSNEMMHGCLRLENDMWFIRDGKYCYDKKLMPQAIGWCYSLAEECMRLGIDCCVSNTFTKKRFIDGYKRLADTYSANFKVITMKGKFKNIHDVPEDAMKSMTDNFDDYPGEIFAYPNVNQDKDDPCYRPYMFTTHKVGDIITVDRFKCKKDTLSVIYHPDGIREGDSFETEKCEAQIDKIVQGTYDYLNVFYHELDTGKESMMTV